MWPCSFKHNMKWLMTPATLLHYCLLWFSITMVTALLPAVCFPREVQQVLLAGDKRVVHAGLQNSRSLFLSFAGGKRWDVMAPSVAQQATKCGGTQKGTPEQMVSVSLLLCGNKIKWHQQHSHLEGNPPGSRRHGEGANCMWISLTQFLMETPQARALIFLAASFWVPSSWMLGR